MMLVSDWFLSRFGYESYEAKLKKKSNVKIIFYPNIEVVKA